MLIILVPLKLICVNALTLTALIYVCVLLLSGQKPAYRLAVVTFIYFEKTLNMVNLDLITDILEVNSSKGRASH